MLEHTNDNYKKVTRGKNTYIRQIASESTERHEIMPFLKCTRCNHQWIPRPKKTREIEHPQRCPKCRTDLWNVPRTYLMKKKRKKKNGKRI